MQSLTHKSMELQHFSHKHPLLFNENLSHENDEKADCAGCGELLSGPNFSCLGCKFYLHKQCAEAPSQMNHPFHPNHSFELLKEHPYPDTCPCDFCGKLCENFVYHCSSNCELDFHIKCALLSNKIAEKRLEELQHIPRVDPLISTESFNNEKLKKARCFACRNLLLDSVFLSPHCGFYLHDKCLDLSSKINRLFHPQHPLILQFNSEHLPCKICRKTQCTGLVYCCSICNFVVQIGCASPPSSIEDKIHHDHPFIFVQSQVSNCDACGISGKYIPYICLTCNLIVHKKCISLPRIIKFFRHHHRLFQTYSVALEAKTLDCRYCREEVQTGRGSYFCSMCNYIVHVNCALGKGNVYHEVDQMEEDEAMDIKSYSRVTTTCIKHFSHDHNLALSEDVKDERQCDGCSLFISTPYYYCSPCDYFLHKSCAELPMKKHIWGHIHQKFMKLTSNEIFKCSNCFFENSGFAFSCDICHQNYCLHCTSISDIPKCEGHKHPLPFYTSYEGICNACGGSTEAAYRCKTCDFNLHRLCQRLPLKIRHQSDDHPYTLTYHDDSNYSERYYCDICEKERNPNYWFYHCSICDNSAHPNCAFGDYPYIKLGSIYSKGDHPHPLTFVQKVQYFPECHRCGKSCLDLALKCKKIGCNYIAHWECIKPDQL